MLGKLLFSLFDNIGFLMLLSCMTYIMLRRVPVGDGRDVDSAYKNM